MIEIDHTLVPVFYIYRTLLFQFNQNELLCSCFFIIYNIYIYIYILFRLIAILISPSPYCCLMFDALSYYCISSVLIMSGSINRNGCL